MCSFQELRSFSHCGGSRDTAWAIYPTALPIFEARQPCDATDIRQALVQDDHKDCIEVPNREFSVTQEYRETHETVLRDRNNFTPFPLIFDEVPAPRLMLSIPRPQDWLILAKINPMTISP